MYNRPSPLLIALVSALSSQRMYALTMRDVTSTPVSLAAESDSSTTTTASDQPFFTSGTISGQPGTGQEPDTETRDVTKTALEWLFTIIVIVAVVSIATWRCAQLRQRNNTTRSIFPGARISNRSESRDEILNPREIRQPLPRTTGLPRARTLSGASIPAGTSIVYPHLPWELHGRYPEPLEPAPAHLALPIHLPVGDRAVIRDVVRNGIERGRSERRSRRAARGADIDEFGRRGGRPDSDDWDDDKEEELPAYESVAVAGPPQYTDTDVRYVGGIPLRVATLPVMDSEPTREATTLTGMDRPPDRELCPELLRESPEEPPPHQQRSSESATLSGAPSESSPPGPDSADANTGLANSGAV